MSLTYIDLQNEVKRRATLDESGTQFDTATKNMINLALIRIANEACWTSLRRTGLITTTGDYETGTVDCTEDSSTWSGTTTEWLTTANASKDRRIAINDSDASDPSRKLYTISAIASDTSLTTLEPYDSTTDTDMSYKILGQEIYTLPIQTSRPAVLWHEAYDYPYMLSYMTEREFLGNNLDLSTSDIPTHYRMWGEDWIINQPKTAGVLRISSSSTSDTGKEITVFGTVSGYPDYETITTNSSLGTTAVSGSKSFTTVERIVKGASTIGRITVDADSANTTIAVLPVGDTTSGIMYKKIQLWPPPDDTYYINVLYYKEPYRLVNDNDVHELGQDFDECIIMLAASKLQGQQSKKEAKEFFAYYRDELKVLRRKNVDRLDWLPRLKSSNDRGSNSFTKNVSYKQIGPHFGPRVR